MVHGEVYRRSFFFWGGGGVGFSSERQVTRLLHAEDSSIPLCFEAGPLDLSFWSFLTFCTMV